MRRPWQAHRLSALSALLVTAALSLAAQGLVTTAAASTAGRVAVTASTASAARPAARPGAVRPRAVGGLDCNGLSPVQRPARPGMMCADPRGIR